MTRKDFCMWRGIHKKVEFSPPFPFHALKYKHSTTHSVFVSDFVKIIVRVVVTQV